MTITRRGAVSLAVLGVILTLGWLAYAPALSGTLLYDDTGNLSGLERIEDLPSALMFILSGDAGPLGRPIALATFAAQADVWGSPPAPFFLANILIHLVNGGLLCWMLFRLTASSGLREDQRGFVALAGTAIWLFMPLLASSSLMVIQRMTTLSASFVLLGAIGYLHARRNVEERPVRSMIGMSAALFLGSGFAMLTKENGALLPVYLLVLESTVLPRPAHGGKRWLAWKSVFLMLPAAAILVYLVSLVPYDPSVVLRRDFTAWERLITESRILWQYLFNAFVPQPGGFGPFHDGYPVARTILDPVTFLAVSSWLVLITGAVSWRRRYPWASLAVLWFVGGHLLESTTIPLELYFEHRNYLPIVGPIVALCAGLAHAGRTGHARLVHIGVSAYALLGAFALFTHTTLWGDPATAARYWQENFPQSVRAARTAARFHMQAEGIEGVAQSLRKLAEADPGAAYVRIPELTLSCISSPRMDHRPFVRELRSTLKTSDFNYTVVMMLSELFTAVTRVDCEGVDGSAVLALADSLLSNPRYAGDGKYNQFHHQLVARIRRQEGDIDGAIAHLRKAIDYQPSADLNMMMVTTYADASRFDAAREFIAQARRDAPWRPMKRFVWLKRLDILARYVDALARRESKHE